MDHEIEYLRKQNPEVFSLEALTALKKLRAILEMPIHAPEPFKSVLQCWHQFKLLAMATVVQNTYPTLTKCWNDIFAKFSQTFEDDVFLEAWCFLDFPCVSGKSYSTLFVEECLSGKGVPALQSFVNKMSQTRLGLYQVVLSNKSVIKLKELITSNVFEAYNTVETFEPGEIFLVRLFPIDSKYMIFSDPKGFPKEKKVALENMVKDKAFVYYGTDSKIAYEKHMKLSGPYWMSVVSPDQKCDILEPNYYKRYLR